MFIWSVDSKENLQICCYQMASFKAKMHQVRFHDLLSSPLCHRSVCSVISTHNLTPVKINDRRHPKSVRNSLVSWPRGPVDSAATGTKAWHWVVAMFTCLTCFLAAVPAEETHWAMYEEANVSTMVTSQLLLLLLLLLLL